MMYYKRKLPILLLFTLFIFIILIIFLNVDLSSSVQTGDDVFFSVESGFYDTDFELTLSCDKHKIYYTLDGSVPTEDSILYDGPITVTDASDQPNVYSTITDVSTAFEKETIAERNGTAPDYQVPDYLIDKAVVIRAVAYDSFGQHGDVKTEVYFVGYNNKSGYEDLMVLSLVTDPENLFDYDTGIYVTGKKYQEYIDEYRNTGEWHWEEQFFQLWDANYKQSGKDWERKADIKLFDQNRNLVIDQQAGIRIHGGYSRAFNPKSLNFYARKEYGVSHFDYDFWNNGFTTDTFTLTQGGNDEWGKSKDKLVEDQVSDLDFSIQDHVPCVLFIDGEYWGFYWITEKYDAEFISEHYDVGKKNVIMIKDEEIEVGDEDDYKYYHEMYEFCSTADLTIDANWDRVCSMIDLESYTDYYALMIYLNRNSDWPLINCSLWRTKFSEDSEYGDCKWRWMVYDLNSEGFTNDGDPIEYTMENDPMFANMMSNDTFTQQLISTIYEIGGNYLEKDKMHECVENYKSLYGDPLHVNEERFFGQGTKSIDSSLNKVDNFFSSRMEFLAPILEQY